MPELAIVMAIMGILAAIAIPTWMGTVEGRRVDAATNQLAADLRLAHASATNRLGTAQIQFSSTGSASFTCGSTPADYCLVRPTAGGTETIARNFEDNVVLNSPNMQPVGGVSTVAFSSDGSASTPNSLGTVSGVANNCPSSTPTGPRLQVTVDGNPAHCLTFNAATSKITID